MLGIYKKSLKAGLVMNDNAIQNSLDSKADKTTPLLNQIIVNDGTGAIKNSNYNQLDLDVLKTNVDNILAKKIKIWAYQDFEENDVNLDLVNKKITLTQNQNATNFVNIIDINNIINNTATIIQVNNPNKAPYYNTMFVLSNQVKILSHNSNEIILNQIPNSASFPIRVWFQIQSLQSDIPTGYSEAPAIVRQSFVESLDDLYATDEENQLKQDKPTSALQGNIAIFDVNKNNIDSNKKFKDILSGTELDAEKETIILNQKQTDSFLSLKEDKINKVIDFTVTDDITYPTSKAVKDNLDLKVDKAVIKSAFSAITLDTNLASEKLVKDNLDLKENLVNKVINFTTPDDITYPTSKAVKDNLDLKVDKTVIKSAFSATTLDTNLASEKLVKDNLDLKEDVINKVIDFTVTDDIKYPTSKAVKDNLDLKVDKTVIKSAFSAITLDTNLASEKLVKDNLDLKEDVINKTTNLSSPDDIKYPTSKAVSDITSLKEDKINKVIDFTAPDDIKYPTSKAVKDNLDLKIDKIVIKSAFSATTLDTNLASEKLVKDNLDLKENLVNKVINFTTPDDITYPTSKAVKDNLDLKIDKTVIQSAFSTTTLDTNLASEKLVKDNLDLKVDKTVIKSTFSATTLDANLASEKLVKDNLDLKENTANKDVTSGYVGLTSLKINFKNTLNTFTSFFINSNTASRNYTFQDKNGTIAHVDDLSPAFVKIANNGTLTIQSQIDDIKNNQAIKTGWKIETQGIYNENIAINAFNDLAIEGAGNALNNSDTQQTKITGTFTITGQGTNIKIRNLIIDGAFVLSNSATSGLYIFENCTFKSTLNLSISSVGVSNVFVRFRDCNFQGSITRQNSYLGKLAFENCQFNSVSITNNATGIEFENCKNVPNSVSNIGNDSYIGFNTFQDKKFTTTLNWNLLNSYSVNDVVNYQGSLYKANANIPTNTAFTIGTTGATWVNVSPISSYVEWKNWIFSVKGSSSDPSISYGNIFACYKVIGKSLHLNASFTINSMNVGSGTYFITLPDGYSISSLCSKTSSVFGSVITPNFAIGAVVAHSSTAITLLAADGESTGNTSNRWGGSWYATRTGNWVFEAEIPIN